MRNFTGAIILAALCCQAAQSQSTIVLKAARLFDGKSDSIVQPGVVVITGNKITAVGGNVPDGAKVIDLGDATLLPGFIDSHTHLSMAFNPDYNGARLAGLERPISESAIRATVNARKTLLAGFTTVRDVGSSGLHRRGTAQFHQCRSHSRPAHAGFGPRPGGDRRPLR